MNPKHQTTCPALSYVSGALLILSILGCSLGGSNTAGYNAMGKPIMAQCSEQSAYQVGHQNGVSNAPKNSSIINHCAKKMDTAPLVTSYEQGYEKGVQEAVARRQQAYEEAQMRSCSGDNAYTQGKTQAYQQRPESLSFLSSCEKPELRTVAITRYQAGRVDGTTQFQDEVCDSEAAQEKGYNQALQSQKMNSSYLKACTSKRQRRAAQKSYKRGYKEGAKALRDDASLALALQQKQQADAQAAAQAAADQQADTLCDSDAAHERGYNDAMGDLAMNSGYLSACPRSSQRRQARQSYKAGFEEGTQTRLANASNTQVRVAIATQAIRYQGRLSNTTNHCNARRDRAQIVYEVRQGRRVLQAFELNPGTQLDTTLPSGRYLVDVLAKTTNRRTRLLKTLTLNADHPNWKLNWGCRAPVVQRAPAQPRARAMSSNRFRTLLNQVRSETYSNGKIAVIQSASEANFFVSAQVKQLMLAMTYDKDRIKAATILHRRTLDKGNWFTIYSALTYDSSKKKLRRAVGQ